jgi:dihydrodipicolinate synthase
MKNFGKILLPLVTPFDQDENVNYEAYAKLIDYVIRKDFCDSLIVTGTTGEFNTLTFDERAKLLQTAVKANAGRKPIIAGTGCASTKETIALTKAAKEAGADMCMVVGPYYCKPSQDAIYLHYKRIAEAVDIDILLYNIPIFVGVNIEPSTVARLAAIKNIVGIKDEAGVNPLQITDYYLATKDVRPGFMLYNGDDMMLMPTIAQGAIGLVSGGAQLQGDTIRKVFSAYEAGNNKEALAAFHKLYVMCKAFGVNGRIHPNPMLKAAITMVTGIDVGNARGPLDPITDSEREYLVSTLKALKLL